MKEFDQINHLNWAELIHDTGQGNWQDHWFLDGENARVFNHSQGMEFYTGPRVGVDADHGVLWTKESFKGDVKITYDYCRLDDEKKCVNIIYLCATGIGKAPYVEDIYQWRDLRKVPAMRMYFNHMNTYHISYAAYGMEKTDTYIRARRYRGGDLEGTDIAPDYDPEEFFKPMVPHQITVIKKGSKLYFHVKNQDHSKLCQWDLGSDDVLFEGRIGLRQMFTRNARYGNLKISGLTHDRK